MENNNGKQDKDVDAGLLIGFGLGLLYVLLICILDIAGFIFLLLHWIFPFISFFKIATPIVFIGCLLLISIESTFSILTSIKEKDAVFTVLDIIFLLRYIPIPLIGTLLYFII